MLSDSVSAPLINIFIESKYFFLVAVGGVRGDV